jgi:hypothetical protein
VSVCVRVRVRVRVCVFVCVFVMSASVTPIPSRGKKEKSVAHAFVKRKSFYEGKGLRDTFADPRREAGWSKFQFSSPRTGNPHASTV